MRNLEIMPLLEEKWDAVVQRLRNILNWKKLLQLFDTRLKKQYVHKLKQFVWEKKIKMNKKLLSIVLATSCIVSFATCVQADDNFNLRNGVFFGDTIDAVASKETAKLDTGDMSIDSKGYIETYVKPNVYNNKDSYLFYFFDGETSLLEEEMYFIVDEGYSEATLNQWYSVVFDDLVQKYGTPLENAYTVTTKEFDYYQTKENLSVKETNEWVVAGSEYNMKIDLFSVADSDYNMSYVLASFMRFYDEGLSASCMNDTNATLDYSILDSMTAEELIALRAEIDKRIEMDDITEEANESVIINCEQYQFTIDNITKEHYDFNGETWTTIHASVRNTSDIPVDYATIMFNAVDENGDTLGEANAFVGFKVDKLKAGRAQECELSMPNVDFNDIVSFEFTSCEVLKDVDGGAARTRVALVDLFYDDIMFIF